MRLTKISGECGKDDCPAIYTNDAGGIVVQGTLLTETNGVTLGAGEALVEIPLAVLMEAADAAHR